MRAVGRFPDEKEAVVFGDVLYLEGITNQVDPFRDGSWVVWVHDDAFLPQAKDLFQKFKDDPDAPEFRNVTADAALKRKQEADKEQELQNKILGGKQLFRAPRMGIITVILIGASIVVTLLSNFGNDEIITALLRIASALSDDRDLPDVMHGQVWRLVTPIFLHFNFLHLLMNILWTKDLGTPLENRHGSLIFLIMVLALAVLSNLAQFLVSGANFGGLSGVVFGLLGYIWIRNRTDAFYRVHLSPQTITLMIAWFVLGFVITWLDIANTAHAAGLGLGMLSGFISGKIAIARRFRAHSPD